MAYRLKRKESVPDGIRRIAIERTDLAIADIERIGGPDSMEAIFRTRKRCKQLRGLIGLARPALGADYRRANQTYRSVARPLAGYRDAQALLLTFDRLLAVADPPPDGSIDLAPVRLGLANRAQHAATATADAGDLVEELTQKMTESRQRTLDWTFDGAGYAIVAGGLGRTYGEGRQALRSVMEQPDPELFHDLRTHAKRTWYHLRLVEPVAPSVLTPLAAQFHLLVDGLGDANDLALLKADFQADPEEYGGTEVVDAAVELLDRHDQELLRRSIGVAQRLYVERPKRFTERIGGMWDIWQRSGREAPVGDLAAVFGVRSTLDALSVTQLRALARQIDLTGRSSMNRADLLAALHAHGVVDAAISEPKETAPTP